ncbi:hypothetical protein H0H93_016119, partial [Arthromyces matolae]
RLRVTGGGLDDGEKDAEGTAAAQSFYISSNGPDEDTPEQAKNLWDIIVRDFEFFPRLHNLYAARPNVVPIAITTGVGPRGSETIWVQPPDSAIDPEIHAISAVQRKAMAEAPVHAQPLPLSSERSFGSDQTNLPSTPSPPSSQRPKASTQVRESVKKANIASIKMIPKKRNVMDSILDMSKENIDIQRMKAKSKAVAQERATLLKEFEAGIWTAEEYKAQVKSLTVKSPSPKRIRREDSFDAVVYDDEESLF